MSLRGSLHCGRWVREPAWRLRWKGSIAVIVDGLLGELKLSKLGLGLGLSSLSLRIAIVGPREVNRAH